MSINSVKNVPEVVAFEAAKRKLQEFKEANSELFDVLNDLVDRYNTTLEAASKATRGQAVSCGDFELYQTATKINGKALHDAVGRERFLALGGTIKTEFTYKVDKACLQTAMSKQQVAQDIYDKVVGEEPRYHAPKPISLP